MDDRVSTTSAHRRIGRGRLVRLGNREIVTRGLAYSPMADFYHNAMSVGWPLFTLATALIFVVVNLGFALLLSLGDDPIANAKPGDLLDLFYFSWETLATVGYGDMHPQTHYGHFISSLESFSGLFGVAVLTGLVFNRIARPKPRLVFASVMIVTLQDGLPTLSVRVANARQNMIADAAAKLWLVRQVTSAEGLTMRRFYELKLVRQENPVFALSWSIFHTIDDTSPLHGLTHDHLVAMDASFALTLSGQDDTQVLRVRKLYDYDDVRWGHRYVEIFDPSEPGATRFSIDYGRFDWTVPEGGLERVQA